MYSFQNGLIKLSMASYLIFASPLYASEASRILECLSEPSVEASTEQPLVIVPLRTVSVTDQVRQGPAPVTQDPGAPVTDVSVPEPDVALQEIPQQADIGTMPEEQDFPPATLQTAAPVAVEDSAMKPPITHADVPLQADISPVPEEQHIAPAPLKLSTPIVEASASIATTTSPDNPLPLQTCQMQEEQDTTSLSLNTVAPVAKIPPSNAALTTPDIFPHTPASKLRDEESLEHFKSHENIDNKDDTNIIPENSAKQHTSYSLGAYYYERMRIDIANIVQDEVDIDLKSLIEGINDAHEDNVKISSNEISESIMSINESVQQSNDKYNNDILNIIGKKKYEVMKSGSYMVIDKKSTRKYKNEAVLSFNMMEKRLSGESILNTLGAKMILDDDADPLLKIVAQKGGKGGVVTIYGKARMLYSAIPEGLTPGTLVSIKFELLD